MSYEPIVNLISAVGFPIFVAIWFMSKTDKIISANTEALNKLIQVIDKLTEKGDLK